MRKTIMKGLGVLLLAFAIMIPTMSQASADQTGGGIGGGCGGGCSVPKNAFFWSGYASDRNQTNSYDKFKAQMYSETGGRQTGSYIDGRVNSGSSGRVPGGTTVCNNSSYVWALTIHAANKWGWASAITFATHGSSWPSNQGTIENPWQGVDPTADQIAAVKKWDSTRNGTQIDKNPGYIIICSGAWEPVLGACGISGDCNFPNKPPIMVRTYAYPEIRTDEAADESHVYSCTVTAEPQVTDVNGNDPIGENNLHPQSATLKTNWGKLVDNFNNALAKGWITFNKDTVEQWQVYMNEATEDDASFTCPTITLDAANKAGMAEGGVMNFTETHLNARLVVKTSTLFIERVLQERTQYWNTSTGRYNAAVLTRDERIPWDTDTDNTYTYTPNPTQQNAGFWQMIAVHCNKADFDKLMAAVPTANRVNTGDTTGLYSSVATSQRYSTRPSRVDFGDPSSTNSAIKTSATLGFFDKECPFSCTSSKTGTGASTANGATTNLNATAPTSGTVDSLNYGALSDKTNTRKFEFFRDNESKQVKLDVWYPRSSGVVSYNGHAPLSTTINRWSLGTPNDEQFKLKDQTGKNVFGQYEMSYNERNWAPTSTYESKNSTKVSGLHRDFTTTGYWVSENNKSQVLNFKWAYAPSVNTVFPATNLGFDSNGLADYGSNITLSTAIQGKCYANFGTTTSGPEELLTQQNTGTGTTNDLDGRLFQEAKAGSLTSKVTDTDKKNLFIKFIRATGE